ncbi:MAG: hypothetical protein H8Z69_04620 [Nanohaloarchaea archaeon]|nr:hypothetical protein [Candidatus Nanohaloarchaea archaeon]
MQTTKTHEFENNPPENLTDRTDIYFTDTTEALEQESLNPRITKKVFARPEGEAKTEGLEEAAGIVDEMTEDVDIYINTNETFEAKEPLMLLEGPAQQLLEPETLNLGIVSHHLTEANGLEHPDPQKYGEAVGEIADIFGEVGVPLADFGARHYHPAQQKELAEAAIENGAVNYSTRAGAETHGKDPAGTMPHAFVLPFAWKHGLDNATLEAAKAMDEYTEGTTPVLIDTANREATDLLEVCDYMEEEHGEDFELVARMDTCGENYAETADEVRRYDAHQTGKGMTVDAVEGLARELIDTGYRENVDLAISSGMGDVIKARQFAGAQKRFEEDEGYTIFDMVGAGSFKDSENMHATSDIYMIEGEPVAKVGREQDPAEIENYRQENMVQVV